MKINNSIVIIGKSQIALRHFKILRSIYKKRKKIFFLDKNSNILSINKSKFKIISKINISSVEKFFLVVICTPSPYHLYYIKKFINNSKLIFVEKPLSEDFNKAKKFYNLIKKRKKNPRVIVGYNLRYLESLKKFKRFIKNKILGKIYYINCSVGKSLDLWRNGSLSFAATKKKKGGGVLLELSHDIDYLIWIFGNLNLNYSHINPIKKYNFNVEQSVFICLSCENKNYKNIPINLTMDVLRSDYKRDCEVICEKGLIRLDLVKFKIELFSKDKKKILKFPKSDLKNSYEKQWKKFLSSDCNMNNSFNNSLKLLKIIKKIKNG